MPGVNILQWIVTGINNQGRDEFIYNNHPISSHYPPALLLKCQMKHCSTLHLKVIHSSERYLIGINKCLCPLQRSASHAKSEAQVLQSHSKIIIHKVIKPSLFSPPHQRKFRVMSELSQWALAEKAEVEK